MVSMRFRRNQTNRTSCSMSLSSPFWTLLIACEDGKYAGSAMSPAIGRSTRALEGQPHTCMCERTQSVLFAPTKPQHNVSKAATSTAAWLPETTTLSRPSLSFIFRVMDSVGKVAASSRES